MQFLSPVLAPLTRFQPIHRYDFGTYPEYLFTCVIRSYTRATFLADNRKKTQLSPFLSYSTMLFALENCVC